MDNAPRKDAAENSIRGAGLGLRRAFIGPLTAMQETAADFYEIAPENWMRVGGRLGKQLKALTEKHTFICHGLSLSLGGPAPLDEDFLQNLKEFLNTHNIGLYSEHLSYCGDQGHLYDLMPIPFTQEAVFHTAERIRRTQEILETRIAIENVSYYAAPGQELTEIDFINAVLHEADCDLLLDINNIYVNSINQSYNALEFLKALPGHRIVMSHMAGHYKEADNLLIDTHGAEVIDPVWQLLEHAYQHYGVFPTLLERDFNIPPLPELLTEVGKIRQLQHHQLKNKS